MDATANLKVLFILQVTSNSIKTVEIVVVNFHYIRRPDVYIFILSRLPCLRKYLMARLIRRISLLVLQKQKQLLLLASLMWIKCHLHGYQSVTEKECLAVCTRDYNSNESKSTVTIDRVVGNGPSFSANLVFNLSVLS